MTEITRPDTDQIKFRSARTGEQVLDAYLEAAEVGDRPLGDLMGELFDAATGKVKPGLVQFRLNGATRELEARSGVFANPDEGWLGTTAFFSRFMGEWVTGTQYRASDYVTISGITYLVTADHISNIAPDMAKLLDIIGNPTLSAIGAAAGAAADKLPYMTGASTAAFADFTAFGRSLVAAASASAARTALGLSAAATAALSSFPSFTMGTGTVLTLAADPVLAMEAATMQWVNARVATKADPIGYTPVNRNGDTLTGFLTAHANPTAALHLATKGYVDNTLVAQVGDKVSKLGDTMSGALTVNAAIVGNSISVGANGVWHAGNLTPSNYAPLAGASFTGVVQNSSVAGDKFRTTGDFGGAFVNWASRGAALAIDAPNNALAYEVVRVTHQGVRSLVGIDAYAGGSDASAPQLQFHFDGAQSAHIFTSTSHQIGGNYVWHAGNDGDLMRFRGSVASTSIDSPIFHGFKQVAYPGYGATLLGFGNGGSTHNVQMQFIYDGTFQFRNLTDGVSWTAWKTVYHSGNFNPAGYIPNTGAPTAVVDGLRLQRDNSNGPIFSLRNRLSSGATHRYGSLMWEAYRDVSDPAYAGEIGLLGATPAGNNGTTMVFGVQDNASSGYPTTVARLNSEGMLSLGTGALNSLYKGADGGGTGLANMQVYNTGGTVSVAYGGYWRWCHQEGIGGDVTKTGYRMSLRSFDVGTYVESAELFAISGGGNVTAAGDITAFSDARVKRDVQPIRDSLARLLRLVGVTFERIDTGRKGVGLIAQDVQREFPQAVLEGADAQKTLSVAYGNLIGPVVEALRELDARLLAVEARP